MSSIVCMCIVCLETKSSPENEVLVCDKCKLGYHQKCHKPAVIQDVLDNEVPWLCRRCLYCLLVEEGEKEMISRMKNTLPYELDSLQWDIEHRVNTQNTYCYCGSPGEFHTQMLQCRRCWQWFHADCVNALKSPLLLGDHYYLFTCQVCNDGVEIVIRIDMDIKSMLAIVLNHLSLTRDEAFFSVQNDIIPFIKNHCHYFELDFDWKRFKDEQLASRVITELQEDERFVNSVKIEHKTNLWGLRRDPLKTPHGFLFYPNKYQFRTIKELSTKSNDKIVFFETQLKEARAAALTSSLATESVSSEECPPDSVLIIKRSRGRPRRAKKINGHNNKHSYAPAISNHKDLDELRSHSLSEPSRKVRAPKMQPKINGGRNHSRSSLVTKNKTNGLSKKLKSRRKRRKRAVNGTSSAKRSRKEATDGKVTVKRQLVNGSSHEHLNGTSSKNSKAITCDSAQDVCTGIPPISTKKNDSPKKKKEVNFANQERPTTRQTLRAKMQNCVVF